MTLPTAPPPQELADAFDLDLQQRSIGEQSVWVGGGEEEGDTTGDGCGESPPQGPTTGC
ncbi:hypothetical protein V1J52_04200 [Streptomyces sp. TRM 70351]|uniref:hypothetical protein n=1 Tax=Streptomyces sp. TRM 70351 TaxID=3116552 RepID=UPI002E7AFFF9|nr:hypothetical protein [Streptomyces sp. TRM 70351]MEE1927391.1 hypothetical protein [Streptomyces sp. TRM 70351]